VHDRNPWQYAEKTYVLDSVYDLLPCGWVWERLNRSPLIEREHRHRETEQVDNDSSTEDLFYQGAVLIATRPTRRHREVRRDPDDEKEEGKDQVSRRPAIPLGVFERRKDRAPGAGVVH